jgi:ABC-2 type transport system permease protein
MTFLVEIRKEIMEQFRTRRFIAVLVVLVAFGMMSPLLAKFMPEIFKMVPDAEQIAAIIPPPTVADAIAQYVKNIGLFSGLLALLLTMGAVAVEKEKGTAAMLLVKPLPRGTFILAKFIGLTFTFSVAILLAAVSAYYYTLYLFEPLNILHFLALNGLMLVSIMFYIAVTLLFSTLIKSQIVAGGCAVGLLLVLSLIGTIPGLNRFLPDQLTVWGTALLLGDATPYWAALIVTVGSIGLSLILAWLLFRKQEL